MSEIAARFTAEAFKEDLLERNHNQKPEENNNNNVAVVEAEDLSPKVASDDQLRAIYRDPGSEGSFGGVDRLYKAARSKGLKTSRKNVARYLSSEKPHTLLHPQRRKFLRRQVETFVPNFLWELDLAEMPGFADRYILVKIDVFSRYTHCRALPNKEGATVSAALAEILDEVGPNNKPKFVAFDAGKEFEAHETQELLRSRGIKSYFLKKPETGASAAERLIRTLKARIYRYLRANPHRGYAPVLQQIVAAYNKSVHSRHGLTPTAALRPENTDRVYLRSYWENRQQRAAIKKQRRPKKYTYRFRINEMVRFRLERTKDIFRKGFHVQFSSIIYRVCMRYPTSPPAYSICQLPTARKDPNKRLDEKYYEPELVRVTEAQNSAPPPTAEEEAAAEEQEAAAAEIEQEPVQIRRPFLPRKAKERKT